MRCKNCGCLIMAHAGKYCAGPCLAVIPVARPDEDARFIRNGKPCACKKAVR